MAPWIQKRGPLEAKSGEEFSELIEFQNQVRESNLKKVKGPQLFQELHRFLVESFQDANRRAEKAVFKVAFLKSGFLSLLDQRCLTVTKKGRKNKLLTVRYFPALHSLRFEWESKVSTFKLAVGDDGDLLLETCTHTRRTIEEVGSEMLKEITLD